jgi:hypothetical protein
MGASAWPRREALMALMEARVGFQGKQTHLPLLLFLQFVKGETLAVLPKYARACIQSPRLLRLAPVIGVFAFVSVAGALLPAALPFAVAAAYPSWARWIWIPVVPLTAFLYYRKLKYSEPVVFRSLLAAVCLAVGPPLSLVALYYSEREHVPRHFAFLIASIVFASVLLLPQAIEICATLVSALIAAALSLSKGPLSAWWVYSRDSVFVKQTAQRVLLLVCGVFAAFHLLVGLGILAVLGTAWLAHRFAFVRILAAAAFILFMAGIVGIFLWDAVRSGLKALRNPRAALSGMGRRALGFGKGVGLLGCGCIGGLFGIVMLFAGYEVSAAMVESHTTAVWMSAVAVVALASAALLIRPVLGGVLRPPRDERDDYARMTPAERLESEWQALSHTTSKWERTFRYLRIARANRATRQDRSAALKRRDP